MMLETTLLLLCLNLTASQIYFSPYTLLFNRAMFYTHFYYPPLFIVMPYWPYTTLVRTPATQPAECGRRRTDLSLVDFRVAGGREIARGTSPWSALLGYRRQGAAVPSQAP